MESNLTKEQITKHIEQSQELCKQKTVIDLTALRNIKEILKTCENNRLGFSDKEDDDENFCINIVDCCGTSECLLVDDVQLMPNDVIVLHAEGKEYNLWETDKSATDLYVYMMDEIEFEHNNSNE